MRELFYTLSGIMARSTHNGFWFKDEIEFGMEQQMKMLTRCFNILAI